MLSQFSTKRRSPLTMSRTCLSCVAATVWLIASLVSLKPDINSANYIYFVALRNLQKLSNQNAIVTRIFTEELINRHGPTSSREIQVHLPVQLRRTTTWFFQIRADYMNLSFTGTESSENKGEYKDSKRRVNSLSLIIHCMSSDPQGRQLISILKNRVWMVPPHTLLWVPSRS